MSRRVEELTALNESLKMNVENIGMDNEFLLKRMAKIEGLFLNLIKNDLIEHSKVVKDDIVNSIQ